MRSNTILVNRNDSNNLAHTGFVISILLLCGLGFITLYLSSGNSALRLFQDELYYIKRQLSIGIIGVLLFIFFAFINLEMLRKTFFPMVIFVFFLCVLTAIPGIGIEKNGARRWIGIGSFTFQPAEIVKFIIVCYLAHIFDKKKDRMDEVMVSIVPAMVVLGSFVFFVYLQDDFSTTLFIFFNGLVIFFFAGIKIHLFITLLVFGVPIAFLFIFTEAYRVYRVISYLKPGLDPYGMSYQLLAAQNAIRSGGFWGKGVGGAYRKTSIIPEVQSDFIFAGWTEEMGFFGVLIYLIILVYMLWTGLKIAFECKDLFRSLLAIGAISSIFFQSILNCGVVSGLFPSTGIPLPFFSSGGTSLAITLAFCGLIINVSRYNSYMEKKNG
ncbi:MAG: putative lipid II flippase FtsW [Treponemataceae bacterium]